MVGSLLIRGILVGLLAGLLAFGFAKVFGEPPLDRAIAFEDHSRQAPPEPALVSRRVQSTIGLLTGVAVYGGALGGLFALACASAFGRIGRLGPRAVAALVASGGFVVLVLVPQLKYPANPPAIGDPQTIGLRTALYFVILALSLLAAIAALGSRQRLAARFGSGTAALICGAGYVAAMAVALWLLPPAAQVPPGFPVAVLWKFRLAALGVQVVLWATLGLVFGVLAERCLARRMRRAWPPAAR
ncbi:MAG TPA: CbtA family protein [Stellaceae bacterium]|nr:CbtA family protein [Stellaceae bacterium]